MTDTSAFISANLDNIFKRIAIQKEGEIDFENHLLYLLQSSDENIVVEAIACIAQNYQEVPQRILKSIIKISDSKNQNIREAVAENLFPIFKRISQIKNLIHLVNDSNSDVRREALLGIWDYTFDEVQEYFVAGLTDTNKLNASICFEYFAENINDAIRNKKLIKKIMGFKGKINSINKVGFNYFYAKLSYVTDKLVDFENPGIVGLHKILSKHVNRLNDYHLILRTLDVLVKLRKINILSMEVYLKTIDEFKKNSKKAPKSVMERLDMLGI